MPTVVLTPKFEMTAFGEGLVEAAQQALAIARGEADPQTYRVHGPQTNAVKAVREELGLTQTEFSDRFGFAVRKLRDLEQAAPSRMPRRKPTAP